MCCVCGFNIFARMDACSEGFLLRGGVPYPLLNVSCAEYRNVHVETQQCHDQRQTQLVLFAL